MIKRKRYSKLPIQANFYPLPSMGYIQDSGSRLSLISGQPLGGTSASSGQLEVMLDRRLMQDDNRGLFQGVQDNRVTPHHFVLLLERQISGSKVLLSYCFAKLEIFHFNTQDDPFTSTHKDSYIEVLLGLISFKSNSDSYTHSLQASFDNL